MIYVSLLSQKMLFLPEIMFMKYLVLLTYAFVCVSFICKRLSLCMRATVYKYEPPYDDEILIFCLWYAVHVGILFIAMFPLSLWI